jgi:hypothetical protein
MDTRDAQMDTRDAQMDTFSQMVASSSDWWLGQVCDR